ncbi:kinesin-like protein KIN-10B [Cynara cardunculus var. scolymus]|uniref:kinesin-like protein KIN-10B n=1 Tax=Cynara cardunculus var. scolymus TaxID=59895 RepID=UPI000D62AED8|nr:kinesin-like protein KIN-10B [Cynara cardunculus var. scolymus]
MATPQLNSSITASSQTENSDLCTPTKHLPNDSVSMVRVIVRVRPFLPHEGSGSGDIAIDKPIPCVSILDSPLESASEVTVHLKDPYSSRNASYKLDSFYGQEDNNVRQIFEREVMPLIPALLNGSNATVFAYGATGSGKTFTMQGTDELPGLMPMAASTILSMCENMGRTVEISYYEIYMERCYDLLEVKTKEIAIFDDKDGHPHLKRLAKIPIHSMLDFQEAFFFGMQRRKVAHTSLNDVSSRSHGVLVISVSRPCENGPGNTMIGKLNLIDLAGNEDNRKTGNEGVRLLESTKINQSLFALSNVIYALNNNNSRIPYRDSKLTRILQDSLGGTSHALMVACLNPGEYEQSVHTVSLAARSRRISNSVHSAQKHNTSNIQVDMEEKLRAWLESKGKTKSTQLQERFRSPPLTRTPCSITSMKKLNTFQSSGKPKAISSKSFVNPKGRSNNEGFISCLMGTDETAYKNKISKKLLLSGDKILLESTSCTLDQQAHNVENATMPMIKEDSLGSWLTSERTHESRNVLSPIKSNENMDDICMAVSDPMTPKQFVSDDKTENTNTPLNTFKAMSCNLKTTLAQEYINFLNIASKMELLQLKGIGEKMAEYILELRDTSPLKSLNDLEKIGLSSKQVGNMFGRTAKGLFG